MAVAWRLIAGPKDPGPHQVARRRATSRTLSSILILTLLALLALTACRRATPTPIPVARTLTHIAATAAPTPVAPASTTPGATPTPTSLPELPPPGISLALPAWLLDPNLQADLAAFLTHLRGNHTELHLLPVGSSAEAQKLLAAGQVRLAILTGPGDAGSELLRQTPFVLASHLAAPSLNLTLAELRALFAGQSQSNRRVLVVGDGAIERELLGLEALRPDATFLPDWPAVVEALQADRQALALLPWASVTPRLRLYPVDGRAFGPDALTSGYPLVQRWRLTGDSTADPALWQTVVDRLRADFTPPISLIAVGDIMLARRVGEAIDQNGIEHPFTAAADWLRAADLTFGNLEIPISSSGSRATDGIAFRADPAVVDGLANAGFDILSLANNHIGDYGPDALLETIQLLQAGGILPVGAGADEAAARKPQLLDLRGLKIALLARNGVPYGAPPAGPQTPGAAWFDPTQTLADVRAASEQADLVVLSLHWGSEYTYAIAPEQRAFVQEALAAGADLILGHHSHNPQALDLGQNWLAAYSLGNFVFDQVWSEETSQGLALRLLLDETGLRAVEPVIVHIVAGQPRLLNWDESKALLADTFELTEGLPLSEPVPAPDAPWTFQTGGRVTGLASGDLDGDGRRELIAATGDLEQSGTVHALRDGRQAWQFQTDARINAVRTADLNADGHDEVLLATGALDQLSWIYALSGDGAQLWRYPIEAKAGDVIAADLDGDGRRQEVLSAEWGSFGDTVRTLNADGALRWAYETSGTPNRLLVADLDGDSAPEIIIGGDGLYALNRFGGLQWKQETENSAYVADIAVADLDGDNSPEIIAGVRYPTPVISVYQATGALRWSHPLTASVAALTLADLSGNGRPEIVAGTVDGAIVALDGSGNLRWQTRLPGAINRLAAADLNGDGAIELIAAAGDDFTPGGVAVLAADGSSLLWRADAVAVTALHVGPLSSERPEIIAGSGAGWVYPIDWTGALPVKATPTPAPSVTPQPTPLATPTLTSSLPGVYRPTQASYYIKVDLDYENHTLQAQERLTFTNTLGLSLTDVLLNVPPNRFTAAFTLSSLTVDGQPAPHTLNDTSLQITLPGNLLPGRAVTLEMTFSIEPPYMRLDSIFGGGSVGYSENAFNAGNWYPVLAPYRSSEGWQAIPWHPVGDPYVTDVAAYIVEIHAPPGVTVVGPGTMENWPDEGRWRFTLSAARTFAFAASHRYESATETAYGITIASFYYPDHRVTGQLILANAAASVRLFSDLYGPYPYPDLRIAETDFSGGQEFSGFMLFGSGTHRDYLDTGGGPRTILFTLISHETAHQWWYGVVGNDQAQQPWLDEALAKYSEQLFYERLYPEHADWRWAWMGMADRQPASLDVTIYDYSSERAYKDRVYLTGALFLAQLRQALGDEVFWGFIRAYYRQAANRIATTDEFLALLSQYGDREATEPIVATFFNRP